MLPVAVELLLAFINIDYLIIYLASLFVQRTIKIFIHKSFSKLRAIITFICLVGLCFTSKGQIDSLRNTWQDASLRDTIRMEALSNLIMKGYVYYDLDSAEYLINELEVFAHDKSPSYTLRATYLRGVITSERGNLVQALEFFETSMKGYEKLGLDSDRIRALSGMARTHGYLGNVSLAVRYYSEVLEYHERVERSLPANSQPNGAVARTLNNIGVLYLNQNDFEKAKEAFIRSVAFGGHPEHLRGLAHAHYNLALIHAYEKSSDSVFYHAEKAKELYHEMRDSLGVAGVFACVGILYQELGNYSKALVKFERVLSMSEARSPNPTMASALNQLASLHIEMKNYSEAEQYAKRGMQLARELNSLHHRQGCYSLLYQIYQGVGNYRKALEMFQQSQILLDSIHTDENKQELLHQEYRHNYLKKAITDSLRNEEERKVTAAILDKERAENAQYQSQQIMLFGGIGILIIFLLVIYNRFIVTKKQKQVIEKQKIEIEEAAETRLELERLKQERLRSDLTNAAQEITRRQEWLEKFKEKLSKVKSNSGKTQEINEVFIDIASQMQVDARAKAFYKNIDKVNQEFFGQLKALYPKLTQNELELSGLVRLNLSTKEIANIRNIEPHSIRIARSRLRKKLGLEKDDSLEDFLQKI